MEKIVGRPLGVKCYRVTPEMIGAGRKALLDRGEAWEEETLAMMYRAMRALAPTPETEATNV
jgi:hypothetical protein